MKFDNFGQLGGLWIFSPLKKYDFAQQSFEVIMRISMKLK